MKCGAQALLATHLNNSLHALNQAIDHPQPQSRAVGLGCKKRIEELISYAGWNTRPVVTYLNNQVRTIRKHIEYNLALSGSISTAFFRRLHTICSVMPSTHRSLSVLLFHTMSILLSPTSAIIRS